MTIARLVCFRVGTDPADSDAATATRILRDGLARAASKAAER